MLVISETISMGQKLWLIDCLMTVKAPFWNLCLIQGFLHMVVDSRILVLTPLFFCDSTAVPFTLAQDKQKTRMIYSKTVTQHDQLQFFEKLSVLTDASFWRQIFV